jgi:hypothetical protein
MMLSTDVGVTLRCPGPVVAGHAADAGVDPLDDQLALIFGEGVRAY